jgi:uncharacterized integral membrane protein
MPSQSSPSRDVDPANSQPPRPGALGPQASPPPGGADGASAAKNTGGQAPSPAAGATTRAATAWLITAVALLVLVLLIILILQNQKVVQVSYLGFTGSVPLGTALLIAAVAGAVVVGVVGVIRLTQLRLSARRTQRLQGKGKTRQP